MQAMYLFSERVERIALVSSGGLGPEVSLLLKAATLPGSELVLPVLASNWVRTSTETVIDKLSAWGLPIRLGKSMEETWRSFETLANKGSREAFLASTRAVVSPRGQTVSAKQHFEKFVALPSLLVWGGRDPMIPASHADNIRREVPNSRIEIFSSAGHFSQLDEPELFFRILDDFLMTDKTVEIPTPTVVSK